MKFGVQIKSFISSMGIISEKCCDFAKLACIFFYQIYISTGIASTCIWNFDMKWFYLLQFFVRTSEIQFVPFSCVLDSSLFLIFFGLFCNLFLHDLDNSIMMSLYDVVHFYLKRFKCELEVPYASSAYFPSKRKEKKMVCS